MTFEEYWQALESSGWFRAYSDDGRAWFASTLARFWSQDSSLTVYCLGRPAYDSEWLAELGEAPRMVVESYARASDGQFQPKDITYEYFKRLAGRDRWCRLAFTHLGNRVTAEFPWLGGEAESAMTRLCNEALAAAGSPYRFYEVPSADQCCYVALVTPEAHAAVTARGWLRIQELSGNRWGARIE